MNSSAKDNENDFRRQEEEEEADKDEEEEDMKPEDGTGTYDDEGQTLTRGVITSDPSEVTGSCGWGSFRPRFLQPLATVWTFLTLYVVFSFTHGVQGSYTISVLTTLERRFNLPSHLSGCLVTVSTVGYLVSAVLVSFFFARRHPPRLFACSMLMTSLCALLYVIPHFVYGTGNEDDDVAAAHAQTNASGGGGVAVSSAGSSGVTQLCRWNEGEGVRGGAANCSDSERRSAEEDVAFVLPAVAMFAVSEVLQGMAGAPIWTIGLAYLDDHTNPELSARLIGIMYAVRFLSPMVSFAMGGYLLSLYASLKETDLTPEHPQWVGAWWLGYFVCSVINLVICVPTSMIPKNLKPIRDSSLSSSSSSPSSSASKKTNKCEKKSRKLSKENEKDDEEDEEEDDDDEEEVENGAGHRVAAAKLLASITATSPAPDREEAKGGTSKRRKSMVEALSDWKELPRAVMRLVTNPVYVLACLTVTIDCFVLGFLTFLPKYVEVYFRQTAWMASLLGGMIPAVFGGCGSLVGGIISGKIKGKDGGVTGNLRMTFIAALVSFFLIIPAMLLSCPEVNHSGSMTNGRLNLTTECNVDCGCSSDVFDPVCGRDGVSFFSPCHAGCHVSLNATDTGSNDVRQKVRSVGCWCVGASSAVEAVVTDGACGDACVSLVPYVVAAVFIFISINLYNVPYTNVILRCIREDDKAFALGLQLVIVCFSVFPAPMMFGTLFESSCLLRETSSCSDQEGPCLVYDRNALRLAFHGLTLGLRAASTSLYFVTYLIARRKLRSLELRDPLKNGLKSALREIEFLDIRETVI